MSGSRSSSAPPDPKAPRGPRVALDALLTGSSADPIRRALWLDALDQRLRPHLPPSLAAHARLANVNGEQLVFLVDSPVWRARLRLATSELLAAARSVGLDATAIVIRTATPTTDHPIPPRAALPMSAAARDALQAALASLADPAPTGSGTTHPGPGRKTRGDRGQAS
jgi:Dna[CI] antecedent DciA-like protein